MFFVPSTIYKHQSYKFAQKVQNNPSYWIQSSIKQSCANILNNVQNIEIRQPTEQQPLTTSKNKQTLMRRESFVKGTRHGPSSKDNRLENMSPHNSIRLESGPKETTRSCRFSTFLCHPPPPNSGCILCHRTSRDLLYTTIWSLFWWQH
jgi:hypothetical protein